jgi:hypothetical protein
MSQDPFAKKAGYEDQGLLIPEFVFDKQRFPTYDRVLEGIILRNF